MADRFEKKSEDEAFVLKESEEMKWRGTFRTISLFGMRISEKMERYWLGGTELNQMQVKRTGNSKKIR